MKRLIAFVLAGYLLLSLVACGSSSVGKDPAETEHTVHSYKKGRCSYCGTIWENEFSRSSHTFNQTTFSLDVPSQAITWSHFEAYVKTSGRFSLTSTANEIGSFVISTSGCSCTYSVHLWVSNGTATIRLQHESGNETSMYLLFNKYSSVLRTCETQLSQSFNELKDYVYQQYDYELFTTD